MTTINRTQFFKNYRSQFGPLKQSQVDGIEADFNEWERQGLSDLRWLAYMLATEYHETDKTFQPIEEYGKGKNKNYGKKIKHSGVSYIAPNKFYYGRGKVMLTWFENYELMGRLLGIDLLKNPELACTMKVAVQVMFEGMLRGSSNVGDFTGKCLEQYFNDSVCDPIGARKIINGTDKAKEIAAHYYKFLVCLTK